MIVIDSHVHIYNCFDVDCFFDSAYDNFQNQVEKSSPGDQTNRFVLLLAESSESRWFNATRAGVRKNNSTVSTIKRWGVYATEEELSLIVQHKDNPTKQIIVVSGHQLITQEKIEVLALFCNVAIESGLNLTDTIQAIEDCSGIAVVPWGAGKWLGKRGRIVRKYIETTTNSLVFLGDNGGRPKLWRNPKLFTIARQKGVQILPGSDPLPLVAEASRVGSCGIIIDGFLLDQACPAKHLKEYMLTHSSTFTTYSSLQSTLRFFINQVQLRVSGLL